MDEAKPMTVNELQHELDTTRHVIEVLMEGQPSGLNVHQARMLMGKSEEENKALKNTVRELADKLMYETGFICTWAENGRSYCDDCPLAWLKSAGKKHACGKNKEFSR